MRLKHILHTSLFALLLLLTCSGFKPVSTYVLGTVSFGTPQEPGHGVCVGRGICDGVAANANAAGTTVSFQLLPSDPNILVLTFSLSDLKANQPEQVAYFTDGSGGYAFDAPYSLSGELFASLNLPPNSQILPTSNSTVVQNGDVITVYYAYSHDQ
jgi:hypothetical protein